MDAASRLDVFENHKLSGNSTGEDSLTTLTATSGSDAKPGVSLGDVVAEMTESAAEAEIDAANGLRHKGGRQPVQEDFDGLLTQDGCSGDIVGRDISDDPYSFGETGSTGGTL